VTTRRVVLAFGRAAQAASDAASSAASSGVSGGMLIGPGPPRLAPGAGHRPRAPARPTGADSIRCARGHRASRPRAEPRARSNTRRRQRALRASGCGVAAERPPRVAPGTGRPRPGRSRGEAARVRHPTRWRPRPGGPASGPLRCWRARRCAGRPTACLRGTRAPASAGPGRGSRLVQQPLQTCQGRVAHQSGIRIGRDPARRSSASLNAPPRAGSTVPEPALCSSHRPWR
jgi:hypothetical protein